MVQEARKVTCGFMELDGPAKCECGWCAPVLTVAEYTGKCQCVDPGECYACPEKEYDQGGEG